MRQFTSIPTKMLSTSIWWLLSSSFLLLAATIHAVQSLPQDKHTIKSAVLLSPKFVLGPGSVENKFYSNIDFPRGHIAVKEFNAEVVDESGNSVPLHETYLHHWVFIRYFSLKEYSGSETQQALHLSKNIPARNAGTCQDHSLDQYFGLGSETRQTATYVPDPYGIEIGNPREIPDGYEERWMLNVHAIDTRGVEDRLGCTECRCDLYNVTKDEYGRPLRKNYEGGLLCCYDQTQCTLKEGFEAVRRELYLKYTVKWVDWDESIVPVKIYILDVTDTGERMNSTAKGTGFTGCQVEYEVESCNKANKNNDKGCVDSKKASIIIPYGGDVIYGVAHQHSGGVGSTLYGQDGRVICSSLPTYGNGKEAGNEAGYIVGMSTCYPEPGSVKVNSGERVTLESYYSSSQKHTGVMGLFYLLVADPPSTRNLNAPYPHEIKKFSDYSWGFVFVAVAVAFIVGVGYRLKNEEPEGYQSLVL